MSKDTKMTQQELMRKFLEDKKGKNQQDNQKFLRNGKSKPQATSKAFRSHNGGGFFDK
ncbi:MAG: hypothetical protein ACK5LY_01695 [Lachnospirales bacterium]